MARPSRGPLVVERLEGRIAMSAAIVPGDVGATVNPALQAFADAFLSHRDQPRYNPEADSNHNGFVGQGDARAILRTAATVTRDVPLRIVINLLPGQQVTGGHPKNSGGVTRRREVTIVGHTTPNSIVFLDNPVGTFSNPESIKRAGRFKFDGGALVSDSRGFFSFRLKLPDRLTQTEYLAFDPFGDQTIAAFPILRLES